jgi:hypothetical protein
MLRFIDLVEDSDDFENSTTLRECVDDLYT